MMRRSLAKSVTTRKVSTQTIYTLAKSRVWFSAPPFQTGDRRADANNTAIIANRYQDSRGISRHLRRVLPRLLINPASASTPEILARGTYLSPGIQSSGRAQ